MTAANQKWSISTCRFSCPLPVSRTQKGKFQLLRFNLAVAVGKQEWVISTAVIWLWQSRIQKWFLLLPFLSAFQLNLQSPELVLSDTTVIKLWKTNRNCSSANAFSFCYCRFREIISLNGSMENTFWFLYGHFLLPWQSNCQNAGCELSTKIKAQQYRREKSCFLL